MVGDSKKFPYAITQPIPEPPTKYGISVTAASTPSSASYLAWANGIRIPALQSNHVSCGCIRFRVFQRCEPGLGASRDPGMVYSAFWDAVGAPNARLAKHSSGSCDVDLRTDGLWQNTRCLSGLHRSAVAESNCWHASLPYGSGVCFPAQSAFQ